MSDAAVRQAADWMQVVDLILAVSILIAALAALVRWRRAKRLLAGVITVAIHGIVFHTLTLLDAVPTPWVNLWSATLRAHIYAFLLATLLALIGVALFPVLEES